MLEPLTSPTDFRRTRVAVGHGNAFPSTQAGGNPRGQRPRNSNPIATSQKVRTSGASPNTKAGPTITPSTPMNLLRRPTLIAFREAITNQNASASVQPMLSPTVTTATGPRTRSFAPWMVWK